MKGGEKIYMVINLRALIVVLTILAAAVIMSQAVHATGSSSGTRPGWGFGDKNHTHTGPPGLSQSVRP